MDSQFIDRIYESAFAPELWPTVLDDLAEVGGARGGVLLAANLTNRNVVNWAASGSVRELVANFVASGSFAQQNRAKQFLKFRYGGFLSEAQVYETTEEMAAEPLYRDWLLPAGLGWCAGTGITFPTGDLLILTTEREYDRGPPDAGTLERLNALRPHLARSALVSARLQLDRARVASETLALIGLPALVFDPNGKVLAANRLIDGSAQIRWRADDRISFKDSNAQTLFDQALSILASGHLQSVRSFAVRHEDVAAMVAHVIPIRGVVRDIFVRCAGVLVMTPVTLPNAPPIELVQSLFDLTPAEARVARGIGAGETVAKIAADGGVSLTTVRTQLRGVLEKTGCHRQAEVVALLTRISPPLG